MLVRSNFLHVGFIYILLCFNRSLLKNVVILVRAAAENGAWQDVDQDLGMQLPAEADAGTTKAARR